MEARDWIDLAQFILTGSIGVWLYLDRRNDRTLSRVADLEEHVDKRLDTHADRLAKVEADLSHAPNHDHLLGMRQRFTDELAKVYDAINSTARLANRLEGEFGAVRRLVEDLNSYLRGKL